MTTDLPECPACKSYAFTKHCKSKGCTWKRCGHCHTVYDDKGHHAAAGEVSE